MMTHMATMKPYILAEYGMSSGLSGVRYNRLICGKCKAQAGGI